MKKIINKEYNDVKKFYKLMKFKNLKEYLTVDILLLNDVFHNFRKMIYDKTSIGAKSSFSRPAVVKTLINLSCLTIRYIEITTCFISKLP